MLEFLKRRKFKKDVQVLEFQLVEKLAEYFPDLAENHKYWTLNYASQISQDEKMIQLIHQSTATFYNNKNRSRHKKKFRIEGVKIFHKQKNKPVSLTLAVYQNLIACIYLPFETSITKEFDVKNISITDLRIEKLEMENPDEKLVRLILQKIPEEQLNLLEIEDSFEISLEANLYYTIFDMEDGNYIAIDKDGSVYRLIHDHNQPVQKIAESVTILLSGYSGNKKELEKYMIE